MKKILLLTFLTSVILFAQAPVNKITDALKQNLNSVSNDSKVLVWVFFTDKGTSLQKYYQSPLSVVSEASLKRRAKVMDKKALIEFSDLPVNDGYVEKLQQLGFEVLQKTKWLNGVAGYVTKANVSNLYKLPFVNSMDIVHRYKKSPDPKPEGLSNKVEDQNNPEQVYSYNYGTSLTQNQQINVPALHDLGIRGQGIKIAVLDAGFNNLAHQCFATMNIAGKWNFPGNDTLINVSSGTHGTMTLSTIGGFKEGSLIGPAFQSTYYLARTEVTTSETPIEEVYWVAGAEWADSLGADVISSSLGYIDFDYPYTSYTWQSMNGRTCVSTLGAVMAMRKGIVVVNSAGNEYDNATHNTLGAPSDADSIVTAGAVTSSGVRVSFSSVGPTVDGRIKPDVMAMGSSVRVASTSTTTGYTTADGTSFSCPLSAGVAALVLCKNPNLTPFQVLTAMRNTASRSNNPDKYYGWGIINALNAANYWPLPVELVSFTGSYLNNSVQLTWKTATEQNNSGFDIERKTISGEFSKIGFVTGNGTTVSESNYSFTDSKPFSGTSVYRLKQIDLNGEYKYSPEVQVTSTEISDFVLYQNYPNPFNPSTVIRYSVPFYSNIKVTLYNVLGNEIKTLFNGNLDSGIHEFKLDGSDLSSGIYFVKLSSGKFQKAIKIALIK